MGIVVKCKDGVSDMYQSLAESGCSEIALSKSLVWLLNITLKGVVFELNPQETTLFRETTVSTRDVLDLYFLNPRLCYEIFSLPV